jgi:hypothetical protein
MLPQFTPTPKIAARFWSRVNRDGPTIRPELGHCWLFPVSPSKRYGYFMIAGKRNYSAHRVAWILDGHTIPDGLCVLHRCDNTRCVRPDHLFLGTSADNNLDRDEKGRGQRGEGHRNAKLTEAQVREIRDRYVGGSRWVSNSGALQKEFGVGRSAIRHIVHRRAWKHVK